MNCDKFRKYISLSLDGRLDAAGEGALKEHLALCPRCREALAALNCAEKAAKATRAREPRAGYWDTFSGRVMRRIESEEAGRDESWWKKWAPITLPPAGKRLRFAGGVASIAVAVVAGALFISRQGDRAIPSVVQTPVEQKTPVEQLVPDEIETPADKGKDMLAEGRNTLGEETATPVEKKVTPPPVAKREASPPATKKDDASSAAKNEAFDVAASSEAPKEEKLSAPAPEKMAQPRAIAFTTADKRGSAAALERSQPIGGATLQKITDTDTTLTVEGLRAHITAWQTLIASSPGDSVTNEGYREVASAYCLLAKQARADAAEIEEGARVIQTYLDRSKDPATKAYLAAKLQEIQKLIKK